MTTRSVQPLAADRRAAQSDEDLDAFLAEHHIEIEAKLERARASIARGEAQALEPLDALLAEARRAAR